MIPGSGRNGAAGSEAFGRRQALFVRRMMVLSLLFHGGADFLGSIVSLPTAADPGANPPPGNLIEERENRMRAPGRRGAGVGIEAEASVMFGGTGQPGGEPIPSWIRDMIRRKVRERLPELETVYNEALRRNPDLKGTLLIRFRIDAAGKIAPTGGRTVDVLYPLVFFVPS